MRVAAKQALHYRANIPMLVLVKAELGLLRVTLVAGGEGILKHGQPWPASYA